MFGRSSNTAMAAVTVLVVLSLASTTLNVQAFAELRHSAAIHSYTINLLPKQFSSTRLYLGFMEKKAGSINTPVLQSSITSDLPSTRQSPATLQLYSNATATARMDYNLDSPSAPAIETASASSSLISPFWSYRLLLAAVACVYGTNFPLGSILDQSLPPSAASASRFFVAALALSPFVPKLDKELVPMALFGGSFTGMGYIAQSLALADTSPATVSFLGAATVIWCPLLEFLIHKQSMAWKDRPQVWIAGLLCLTGVGLLELFDGSGVPVTTAVSGGKEWMGDGLALLQAVGFGTGIFMSEQMMKKQPQQALSITSVMVAVTAFWSLIWALSDGWMGSAPAWESMLLPNILMGHTDGLNAVSMDDPFLLGKAVLWTGLISTSLNFFLEIFALGQVPPGEASVILATEPLWAAAFASIILGETMGWNDYAGGFLIVAACLISGAQAADIHKFLSGGKDDTK
ncbi:EamA-like transporter family protein [Nitzschia inconspicua]|uniref:EamA-like transporter family protein n=1 Tax=Nitzschia inconspicua TaxID=303405 RepID=A0A9K3M2J2_9STRA|nr:EamA-like transporter family protein [Nitzschia inconspicua]